MSELARPAIVAATVAYFAVVLAIGAWSARRTRSPSDFFAAGRRLRLVVAGLATMATAFSGFVFVGGPGLAYRIGLGSLWIVLPLGFTSGLMCWVVGARLRALAAAREVLTVPDALALRFGSRAVTALGALAVLCGSVAYLGLQAQALGVVLRPVLATPSVLVPIVVGVGVLALYCFAGGMVAGVYTDVFQGTLMLVVAAVVFGRALAVAGGWDEVTGTIGAAPAFGPAFLDPLGRIPPRTAFGWFFVFGVGVLGQPHVLHKFFMVHDARSLRWLPLVLAGGQAVCVLLWLGVGLAVPALEARGLVAPLAHPDDAAPTFLLRFTPPAVAGLAFAGILAAIMSTASSLVNIASAALVRDLPRVAGLRVGDEVAWGRWATLGLSGLAAAVAYFHGDLIALLGTFAFGTFAAALGPTCAVGLAWRRVPARAAAASIATGLVLSVGLELAARAAPDGGPPGLSGGMLPAAAALVASLAVLLAVTALAPADGPGAPAPDVARALDL